MSEQPERNGRPAASERRKWIILAGLVCVLAGLLALQSYRAKSSRAAVPAEGSESNPGAESVAAGPEVVAPSRETALELAKAILQRPTVESLLPERDLFAPRAGGDRRHATAPEAHVAAGSEHEPARVPPRKTPRISLTATFRDGGTRLALLDGTFVREGEKTRDGYVLTAVEENRVILKREGDVLVVDMATR